MRRRSTKSQGSIEVRHTPPVLAAGLQYQAMSGELMKRARTQQRRMSLGASPGHARWFMLRDDMLHYFMSEAVSNGPSRDVLCLQVRSGRRRARYIDLPLSRATSISSRRRS